MHARLATLTLLALVGAGALARAQTSPPPPPPPEAHQFDFWLGEWEVTNPAGQRVGTSRVESVAGGRGLLEHWTGASGLVGKSLNTWNAAQQRWQQFWVGGDGSVLELAGRFSEGRMVLAGESRGNERRTLERITWAPQPDGSVRQIWEQSADGGATWSVAFDGRYTRKTPPVVSGGGGGGGGEDLGPSRRMYLLFM